MPRKKPDDMMMRGVRLRLYTTPAQAAKMDLWRRRAIALWNLLLSLESAAYSGEKVRPELRWREKLVEIAKENYARDLHVWDHGRAGKRARKPGHELIADYQRDLAAHEEAVEAWKQSGRKGAKPAEPKQPKAPEPPSPEWIAKILNGRDGTVYSDERGDDGELPDKAYQPRLFIWKRELMALMARLKQEPLTGWIGDLPSHGSQRVCADLVQAIETMLRERGKAAKGLPSRKTGFPKFKAGGYANGSVYFAYTQIAFRFDGSGAERHKIRFPGGIGSVNLYPPGTARYSPGRSWRGQRRRIAARLKEARLMGGRIYRTGEEWWIACQVETKKPEPLPATGREAGVKIAAAVMLTTFDGRSTRQVDLPPVDKRLALAHRKAQQQMARCHRAAKVKAAKMKARGKNIKPGRPIRLRPSRAYLKAAATRARIEARSTASRDGLLHRETARIVKRNDKISVQRMDVSAMMKRSRKRLARHERHEADAGAPRRKRDVKSIRLILRRAAMSRTYQLLKYKTDDYGRERHDTEPLKPNVQICNRCGHKNEQMTDGRLYLRCGNCGHVEERRRNAARNEFDDLKAAAKQAVE